MIKFNQLNDNKMWHKLVYVYENIEHYHHCKSKIAVEEMSFYFYYFCFMLYQMPR